MVYSEEVMKAARQNMGLDEDDVSSDTLIEELPKSEVFERYLIWQGIIGFGRQILKAIEDIYKVELNDYD